MRTTLTFAALAAIAFVVSTLTFDDVPETDEQTKPGSSFIVVSDEALFQDHRLWIGAAMAFALAALVVGISALRDRRTAGVQAAG